MTKIKAHGNVIVYEGREIESIQGIQHIEVEQRKNSRSISVQIWDGAIRYRVWITLPKVEDKTK